MTQALSVRERDRRIFAAASGRRFESIDYFATRALLQLAGLLEGERRLRSVASAAPPKTFFSNLQIGISVQAGLWLAVALSPALRGEIDKRDWAEGLPQTIGAHYRQRSGYPRTRMRPSARRNQDPRQPDRGGSSMLRFPRPEQPQQEPKRSAPMKERLDTIGRLRSRKPSTPRIAALANCPVPTSFA